MKEIDGIQCFLTIPAIVYQVMVPMWSRALRFANVYAYAVVDLIFTVLWFSAFIAVETWVNSGKSQGGKDQKKAASCDVFAFGSSSKCTTGEAIIAFGVFIFHTHALSDHSLLFVATSAISIHQALRYRQSGVFPDSQPGGAYTSTGGIEDNNKDAWSADTGDLHSDPYHHDHDSDDNLHDPHDHTDETDYRGPHRGNTPGHHDDDQHGLLHGAEPPGTQTQQQYSARPESWETEVHPGRPLSWGTNRGSGSFVRVDTEYHGVSNSGGASTDTGATPTLHVQMPDEEDHRTPSALSPGGYEQEESRRPVRFPAGPY
ncbi:MAG: hypothetical protein Q9165_004677 [Trypethelium subeluteriae]